MGRRSWVKLWADILDSRQLAKAGEAADWLFTRLLVINGESGEGDILADGSAAAIAWRLRRDESDIETRLSTLEGVGLIERNGEEIRILGWFDRQAQRTDAERMRDYRKKRSKRVRNKSRTCSPIEREEERETEREQEERETRVRSAKPPRAAKRRSVLPPGWSPKATHDVIAKSEGVSLEREATKFREHAGATGRLQLDWDLAFNTWLRKARDYGAKPKTNSHTPPDPNEPILSTRTQRMIKAVENVVRKIDGAQENA